MEGNNPRYIQLPEGVNRKCWNPGGYTSIVAGPALISQRGSAGGYEIQGSMQEGVCLRATERETEEAGQRAQREGDR